MGAGSVGPSQAAVASGSFALFKSIEKGTDVVDAYQQLVSKEVLRHDQVCRCLAGCASLIAMQQVQLEALRRLSTIQQSIKGYQPTPVSQKEESASSGFLGGFFGSSAPVEVGGNRCLIHSTLSLAATHTEACYSRGAQRLIRLGRAWLWQEVCNVEPARCLRAFL